MKLTIQFKNVPYQIDLLKGVSISTPFHAKNHLPRAFYSPDLDVEPVRNDGWVGSTTEGGILNFKNIFINPHGNGTHTECVGHIAIEPFYIKDCLKASHHLGQLFTIYPTKRGEDTAITLVQLQSLNLLDEANCIMLRTLPNSKEDKIKDWSGTNPTYIDADAMAYLVEKGFEHFMIDTPSVDRENDEGKLLAHKTFWNYPGDQPRKHATITEMFYAPKEIEDGLYFVNIQVLPFLMDASPSNIILYKIEQG